MSDRHGALRELIEFAKPIDELRSLLAAFEWDFRDIPLILTRDHLRNVLDRYVQGELSNQQVEDWANLVESREDLAFKASDENTLSEIIYALANPELTEELTQQRAKEMINAL